jgi:hypothetical protein
VKDQYEIRPLVDTFLGIPVICYGIVNISSGIWVTDKPNIIWTAPRWILRRWIRLHEKVEEEE